MSKLRFDCPVDEESSNLQSSQPPPASPSRKSLAREPERFDTSCCNPCPTRPASNPASLFQTVRAARREKVKEKKTGSHRTYIHTYIPYIHTYTYTYTSSFSSPHPSIPPSTALREVRKRKKINKKNKTSPPLGHHCLLRALLPCKSLRPAAPFVNSTFALPLLDFSSVHSSPASPRTSSHHSLTPPHTPYPTLPTSFLTPSPRSTSPARLVAQFLPSLPLSLFPSPPRAYHSRLALRFLCIINDRPILQQGATGASRHFILSLSDPRHSSHS